MPRIIVIVVGFGGRVGGWKFFATPPPDPLVLELFSNIAPPTNPIRITVIVRIHRTCVVTNVAIIVAVVFHGEKVIGQKTPIEPHNQIQGQMEFAILQFALMVRTWFRVFALHP